MPKAVQIDDFAVKLDVVCKKLNLSRGKLAQQVGIDKSMVGRWIAGASRPAGNTLMRLNDVVAKTIPGFTAASWDLTANDLAARLGIASPPPGETAVVPDGGADGVKTAADFFAALKTVRRTTEDIDALAGVYAGFYDHWSATAANSGAILFRRCRIWRDGDALRIEVVSGVANWTGVCVMAGASLVAVLESTLFPGLALATMGGAHGRHARRLAGLAMVYQHSRNLGSFVSYPIVLDFLQPMSGDREADERLWRTLAAERRDLIEEEEIRTAVPPELLAVLRPVIGTKRADGAIDHILSMPFVD